MLRFRQSRHLEGAAGTHETVDVLFLTESNHVQRRSCSLGATGLVEVENGVAGTVVTDDADADTVPLSDLVTELVVTNVDQREASARVRASLVILRRWVRFARMASGEDCDRMRS